MHLIRFCFKTALVLTSLLSPLYGSAEPNSKFYALNAPSIEGAATTFSTYSGQVVLVVNTASQCGYTPQYDGLEKLYVKYKSKGLVILGFPSSDFGGQEPGTNSEIKKFCKVRFGVTFPLFAKSHVAGAEKNAVYQYLTSGPGATSPGEVEWNFEKFLVSRKGQIVARFKSAVTPTDKSLVDAIEKEVTTP